jgi:hypothetical protein
VSFLFPAFLAGAVAAAIPIILHLLTREAAPRLPFSAVQFLKRVPVADSRRRLRELLLLALRVTALVLLALAFARPFLATATSLEASRVTIVIVDTSFSMGAPGQFARAQALARDAVGRIGSTDRVGVVSFSDTADVAAPPADRGQALAAIDRLQPGFGATRYASAIAKAVEQIGDRAGRIVLVTDLQKSGWDASPDASVPGTVTIEVLDAGAPTANLAVTDLRKDAGSLVAMIRNAGSQPITSRAQLIIDGTPAGEAPVIAAPSALTEVRFTAAPPEAGVVIVQVDDEQGYPADNARYFVLDPPSRASLLTVTTLGNAASEAFYLERALMVNDQAFALTTIGVGDLSGLAAVGLADRDAVLLLGTRGLDRRGREVLETYVTRSGALLLVSGPDLDADAPARIFGDIKLQARLRDAGSVVSFAPTDGRHPIFRPFGSLIGNLGHVRFDRSVLIDDAPGAKMLARFSDGKPALLEYQIGSGRVLYFASDLNRQWNDFPLQSSFVPFVQNVMRYLTASVEAPREYLVADAPAGVRREPGIASLRTARGANEGAAAQVRRVAINVDTRESDPTRIGAEPLIASIARIGNASGAGADNQDQGLAARLSAEGRQNLWRYGLALMLASLVFESALGRKM